MSGLRSFRMHPWRTAFGVAGALALAMLVIPVSYQRTTGHDVAVTVSGAGMGTAQAKLLATRFGTELGGPVQLAMTPGTGGDVYELSGFVPAGSGVDASALAEGFVKALESSGLHAAAEVAPRVERVSGSVYAMARDRVVRIEVSGKTAAEIEAEIRDALVREGAQNPEVSVTDEDGGRRIEVTVNREGTDPDEALEEPVDIVLTQDGQELAEPHRCQVTVKQTRDDAGVETMVVDADLKGQKGQATVRDPESLGDMALAREIENQLRAAGLDVVVGVENGKVEIRPAP